MYVLGVSFQETFSNAQVIGHQFELGNFGTRRELSGNFVRKIMRCQQNTVSYLFDSQLKVTIEHISLGKNLVFGKKYEIIFDRT